MSDEGDVAIPPDVPVPVAADTAVKGKIAIEAATNKVLYFMIISNYF